MQVRDLIKEAIIRAGLCKRTQAASPDMTESAYQLLLGQCKKFASDNFLAFTQATVRLPNVPLIHIFDKVDTMIGEANYLFDYLISVQAPASEEQYLEGAVAMVREDMSKKYTAEHVAQGVYRWIAHDYDQFDPRCQEIIRYSKARHINIREVSKLNTLMTSSGSGAGEVNYELTYTPPDQFDRYVSNCPCWTYDPLAEGEWIIEVKQYVSNSAPALKLNYNKKFSFDIDTDLRIPDNYIELLIVGLTYKLALKYPRLDPEQMARLKTELDDMISNVSVPKADMRMVVRDTHAQRAIDANNIMTGAIFGGY